MIHQSNRIARHKDLLNKIYLPYIEFKKYYIRNEMQQIIYYPTTMQQRYCIKYN